MFLLLLASAIAPAFEENRGQWGIDEQTRFVATVPGYAVAAGDGGVLFGGGGRNTVTLRLGNGARMKAPRGADELVRRSHYLRPGKEVRDVRHFAGVRYDAVLPGIDMILAIKGGVLEYDFDVAAGADPSRIALQFPGASKVALDENGSLLVDGIRHRKPVAWQDGKTVSVALRLRDGVVSFDLGEYDSTKKLIIDPVVEASTRYGAGGLDFLGKVAVDSSGAFYITGQVNTAAAVSWIPAAGSFHPQSGGGVDAFITKIAADGKTVMFSSYLGGEGDDMGYGVAVDGAGNPIVVGATSSTSFFGVIPSAIQADLKVQAGQTLNRFDAFVAKLNANGSQLLAGTYLGGFSNDEAREVAVDAAGNIYLAGTTRSTDFVTTNGAYSRTLNGAGDIWFAKINSTASARIYSTFVGGPDADEYAAGIAVDSQGALYAAGTSYRQDFPITSGAFQTTRSPERSVGFALKLNPSGTALVYSSYLGGNETTRVYAMGIDGAGNAVVAGETYASNFPVTIGSAASTSNSAFVTKFNAAGSGVVYSRVIGTGTRASAVAVEPDGKVHVGGTGLYAGNPPITPTANALFPTSNTSGTPSYFGYLAADGSIAGLSYFYGSGSNQVFAIYGITQIRSMALVSPGVVAIAGDTDTVSFPITFGAFQPNKSSDGIYDGFVTRISYNSTCSFTLSNTALNLGNSAANSTITVTTQPGCTWAVAPDAEWITTEVLNQTQFRISVGNNSTGPRAAKVYAGGKAIDVTQITGCTYVIAPSAVNIPAGDGAAGTFQVTTGAGCPWTPSFDVSWIRDNQQTPVQHTGAGQLIAAARTNYSTSPRSATVAVAPGVTATVTQAGNPCSYVVGPNSFSLPSGTATLSYTVNTGVGCPWDMISNLDWVSPPLEDHTGTQTRTVYVPTNTGSTRTGTIQIAGQPVTITQCATPPANNTVISIVSGNNQSAFIFSTFAQVLRVQVKDTAGNPVCGAPVIFTVPSSGASAAFGSGGVGVVTDSNGFLSTPALTANGIIGSYIVRAQVGGTLAEVNFNLTNLRTAALVHPVQGAALRGTTAQFSWVPAGNEIDFQLDVGTSAGSGNIYSGTLTTLGRFVTGIPCNGAPVYARLRPRTAAGPGAALDYTFTASTNCAPDPRGMVTSPEPGSSYTGGGFSWTAGVGALDYWLDVGTVLGQGNIAFGVVQGTSQAVSGIPCNGAPLFIRLWTRTIAGYQPPVDFVYSRPNSCGNETRAALTDPSPGSRLPGSTVTFIWSPGNVALDYWLDVGTAVGQGTIFGGVVTATSKQVTGIPCDGRVIHVRLWTRIASGYLSPFDYTFNASLDCSNGATANITTPPAGSTLASQNVTFTWTAGTGALDYWFDLGTALGQGNIQAGVVTGTSKSTSAIPCTGQTIFVRLWTRTAAGYQQPRDYQYTAPANCAGDPRGRILEPRPGTIFTSGATITFYIGYLDGVQDFWLDVGSSVGQGTYFAALIPPPGGLGAIRATNIPCDNKTLHVRLWTRIATVWQEPRDYVYYCNTAEVRGQLRLPLYGVALPASTTFSWTPGVNAQDYWLDVGTVRGQGNIFAATVNGLSSPQSITIPRGSIPIWIRLWTRINGVWREPLDYEFVGPP